MPSETLENHLENIAWIALSISLFILSTSTMNRLTAEIDGQRLRAAALLVKDCLELSWKTGCTLKVPIPDSLGKGKMRVEIRAGTVVALDDERSSAISLDVPVRDSVIQAGGTYKIVREDGVVIIEEIKK